MPWARSSPAVVDDAYEREVQRSTSRLERLYARAQRRAERAEERLRKARSDGRKKVAAHVLAQLEAVVQMRRDELEEYRRMMVGVPASADHRGTRSFRPVPVVRQDSAL